MARRPIGDKATTSAERQRRFKERRRREREEAAREAEKLHEALPKEEPPRIDRLDGSGRTASGGSAQQIGKLIYWTASVLAAIALVVATYVAVAEQRPFNWPVAAVFGAVGIGIWLVGWAISYLFSRR